ncbi:OmpA family protein [Pontibacter chitinilyticus]|uniref:OmpA family protein n=1 Tax=Pontibacter chitinilyticus TaxID=2674989 RepID=UPI00321955FC
MKKSALFYVGALMLLFALPVQAQFNLGRKLQDKINQKVDQQVDKKIDEALEKPKKGASDKATAKDVADTNAAPDAETGSTEVSSRKVWSKYDFVPGDKVLFEDNLAGEENGEFPSRWDLRKGNAEVASFGDEPVINLVESGTSISPLVKKDEWLPETFTVEMDLYFDTDNPNVAYDLYLYSDQRKYNEQVQGRFWDPVEVMSHAVHFTTYGSTSEELEKAGTKGQWRHVSIAFNKRSMKVYLDQYRLINIPNVEGKPTGLRIECDKRIDANTMVKNVFVAEGGKKLYDQVLADGKIVTHGIKFDVNKAIIRPESVGTLESIAKLMKEQTALNFSVEGHTDSDGDSNTNQRLSQQRAEAVKAYLVAQGIPAKRLAAKGWGSAKPLDKNNSPEAKSNNRRVEFVKL